MAKLILILFLGIAGAAHGQTACGAVPNANPMRLAVLPDTQYITDQPTGASTPTTASAWLNRQMQWIIDNQASCHIVAVVSLGDMRNQICVDGLSGVESSTQEGAALVPAIEMVDAVSLPLIHAFGNHEGSCSVTGAAGSTCVSNAGSSGDRTGSDAVNWYIAPEWIDTPSYANTGCTSGTLPTRGGFSRSRLLAKNQPWWQTGSQFFTSTYSGQSSAQAVAPFAPLNRYITIDAEGRHFLIISLEYKLTTETKAWAISVAADHPNYETIITTHAWSYSCWGDDHAGSTCVPAGNFTYLRNNGLGTLAGIPNLMMILGGHFYNTLSGLLTSGGNYAGRQDNATDGHPVTQLLTNWQQVDLTGGAASWNSSAEKAFVALVSLPASGGNIDVRAISTNTGNWLAPYSGVQPGDYATTLMSFPYSGVSGLKRGQAPASAGSGARSSR